MEEPFTKPLSAARFDLYTIGTRLSLTRLISDELSYWADHAETVLGLVFRDLEDNDFGWSLFARDRAGRFRCVDVKASLRTERIATELLRSRIATAVRSENIAKLGFQGDEPNEPVDLLRVSPDSDPKELHPFFKILLNSPARAPARAVLKEIGPWLAPSDPHFITEFQLKQFDQRLWELYLWAALRELGFDIEQPEAPDFLCGAPGYEFTVEATTVSASSQGPLATHPEPGTPEEMRKFLADYMPMKFGSSLTSKLTKKNKAGESYWERGVGANKPFMIAVADFHKPGNEEEIGSMTYTHSALWPYLYGHRVDWDMIDGKLAIRAVRNQEHRYGDKVIPSGFFDLPGAENVSAVLFSNAGTLSKFDRMGIVAGFAPAGHKYFRVGVRFDPDPNAVEGKKFMADATEPGYQEFWSDELQIFHNPNATHPFSQESFGGITQHFFKNGQQYSLTTEGTILASQTLILSPASDSNTAA